VLQTIPFHPTAGHRFDAKLVGADLELSDDAKTVCRALPGRPTYALWGKGGFVAGTGVGDAEGE